MPAPFSTVIPDDRAVAPQHPDTTGPVRRIDFYGDSMPELVVRGCIGCIQFGLTMTAFVLIILTYIRVEALHTALIPTR